MVPASGEGQAGVRRQGIRLAGQEEGRVCTDDQELTSCLSPTLHVDDGPALLTLEVAAGVGLRRTKPDSNHESDSLNAFRSHAIKSAVCQLSMSFHRCLFHHE
jgi:hypothetical protein